MEDAKRQLEDIDSDMAAAFGFFALTSATLHDAAVEAGVTRWRLEEEIERAGLAEVFGLDIEGDVSGTIDELLDGKE